MTHITSSPTRQLPGTADWALDRLFAVLVECAATGQAENGCLDAAAMELEQVVSGLASRG